MTDEEKAKDYRKTKHAFLSGVSDYFKILIEKCYLDGLAEGRKEKWHDLRKNPNDLPKEQGEYRIYFYDSELKANRNVNWYYCGKSWACCIDVIAWYELPKFEE